ncbi:MAG: TolC family protein [Gemmatimonadota bacterium]
MWRSRSSHGLLAAGLLLGGATHELAAQSQSPPLTLSQLYRSLDEASPQLASARAGSRAALERVAPTRRPPDPQLQFGLMNRNFPGLGLQDPLGMNQVQLMQMLPFPGKLGAAGKAAAARAGATTARADDLWWEMRAQAAMTFYDIYGVDRSIVVATQGQALLRDIAATSQSMYSVGEGPQADVLRAQVEVSRMTEELLRMQTMRETMVARLNALLDRAPDRPVGAPVLPKFPDELPALDSLISHALTGRPMLEAGKRDVQAAEANRTLAHREIWPDLQLGAIYGQRPMTGGGTDRMVSFMLGFSIPFFAGSRQLPMRREADAMRDMARAELGSMIADTRGRIGVLYSELRRARSLRALYETDLLPQTQAAVTASLGAYRVGEVNLMTLLDARMTVYRYQQERYQLEAAEGKAWAELEMLLGAALFDADQVDSTERPR